MSTDQPDERHARLLKAITGHESQIITALIPEATRHAGRWCFPLPGQPKATLTFDVASWEWEITGPTKLLATMSKTSGSGLLTALRRGLGCSKAEAATRVETVLSRSSRSEAQDTSDPPDSVHSDEEIPNHHYAIMPARWWRLVLKQGLNAGRVAAHLLTTTCVRKSFNAKSRKDPEVALPHTSFAVWGLNPSTVNRAVKRLVKAKLITQDPGVGRTSSRYTLLISQHFEPRPKKSRRGRSD